MNVYTKVMFDNDPHGLRTYFVDAKGERYPENPDEVLAQERAFEWHHREKDYPSDDYGYPYCASCGVSVTAANFAADCHAGTKDYCKPCADLEQG